jgi:Tfp pilus assembly protein PilE
MGVGGRETVTRWRHKIGFSVIEFMILVALICIVTAIGVPNFIEMQYRAQRAEVPTNIDGIRAAAVAYQTAHGRIMAEDIPRPDAFPGNRERPWKTGTRFDALGWEPEGTVRGSYSISTTGPNEYRIKGYCDVDGDGTQAVYTATSAEGAKPQTKSSVY